jgi:hypothetical protein
MPVLTCPECGNQFEPRKAWQKYCGKVCNQAAYLRRKVEKMRSNPHHILDFDLGPSPTQEAEWKRREDLADDATKAQNLEREQDAKAKAEKVAKLAEDEIKTKEILQNWYDKS